MSLGADGITSTCQTTAVLYLLHVLGNGASAEIAMVGNMGIVGVALFLGGDTILNRAVVRNAGQAYRLEVKLLQKEFDRSGRCIPNYSYTLALMRARWRRSPFAIVFTP